MKRHRDYGQEMLDAAKPPTLFVRVLAAVGIIVMLGSVLIIGMAIGFGWFVPR